jgi:hypothetical protein
MNRKFLVALLACFSLCGCQTYQYRIAQPPTATPVVDEHPVVIHYDPLDYSLRAYHEHLAINISNPTEDRIDLLGGRSFVVDPKGESHPLRDRVIGPHSYTRILLPPIPFSYAYPDYWGWSPRWGVGWGPGWYDPFWGGWYGPWAYGPPAISYEQILTVYDWEWKTGLVRLRLTYNRNAKSFEHNFEIIREKAK